MPVVRPALHQSSIVRKLVAYGATFRQGIHRERYAMENFRVLMVTESATRAQNMIEAFQEHAAQVASPKLFLFTTREKLLAAETNAVSDPHLARWGREVARAG